jgi:hypothetical protein
MSRNTRRGRRVRRGAVRNRTPANAIRVREVLDVQEETYRPTACFPTMTDWSSPSARASTKPVAPWRPDYDPPLGMPVVRQGQGVLTSSKPSASTKKLMAGSYSLTTMAMRPRWTAPPQETGLA